MNRRGGVSGSWVNPRRHHLHDKTATIKGKRKRERGQPFSKLMEGAKKDGLIEPTNSGDCGGCPDGYYKVQIYLDDTNTIDRDYHVYRQNSGGGWPHKLGRAGRPRQMNTCPMDVSRKFPKRHYKKFCGTLCKKDN